MLWNKKNIVISLVSFLIVIGTPSLLLYDIILYPFQSDKYIISFVIGSIVLILSLKNIKFKKEDALFYLLISLMLVSGIIKFDIKNIILSLYCLFFVLIISVFSVTDLKKFLNIIVTLLGFLSIIGIFQVILFVFFGYDNYLTLIVRSIDSVRAGNFYYSFYTLLGGSDSYYFFKGIYIPRFLGYVDQASATSIVMLLPASLYFIFIKKLRVIPIIIILFSLFSLGMSTYICLILSSILFIFFYKDKLNLFIFAYAPLVIFILIFLFLYFDVINFVYGDDIFKKFDFVKNNIVLDYTHNKLTSGIARLSIIERSVENLIKYPWFGMPLGANIGFGLLFVSYGQNYGFLSSFILIFIFIKIFKFILQYYNNSINKNIYLIYGFSLLYSILLEIILFNDYAASRLWGFVFIFIVYRFFYLSLKVDE